jgi:sugar phosphate isomerase/epimerase
MSKVPVALQLFSVRGETARNLPQTLETIARIGYVGAEPWGYTGDELEWSGYGAKELRKLFDDSGLACCGMHVSTDAITGDRLERTMELNQTLGNRFVIVAMDKQRMSSVDTIEELAGILDRASERLGAQGMFAGYHAHGFDFADVEGEVAWYRLFEQVGKDVIMQLDVGNCAGGGGNPVEVLRKFPGRARSVHLKEYGKPDAVIGEGDADWAEIFRLCEHEHGTEWYVIEEGSKDGIGFEICSRSLAALKRFGKA